MPRYIDSLQRAMSGSSDHVYAAIRIALGLLFAFHGAQKVLGVLAASQPPVFSQIWIGGVIELITGVLVAIGLFTRAAAFVASGTMAVAYTQFHWKLRFDANFLPVINRGELALVYSLCFLYIATAGARLCGVDGLLARRQESAER